MKRNLQAVVNKVNVVVVSVVVILVVVVTVVSSVRVIGLEKILTGVAIENVIEATPVVSGVPEIAGVVVVNPKAIGVPVHVQPSVVSPVGSNVGIGRIHDSRYFGGTFIGNSIYQRAQINNDIDINDTVDIASIERITIFNIRADIFDVAKADAGLIADIDAAPIFGNSIGVGSIAQIEDRAVQNMGAGNIADIAAAKIIDYSANIGQIS